RVSDRLVVDHHLDHAAGIAQVDEGHPTVVSTLGHPAAQDYLGADGVFTQVSAVVGSQANGSGHSVTSLLRTVRRCATRFDRGRVCWSAPNSTRGRTVATSSAISCSPTSTAKGAPERSAAFIWALMARWSKARSQ